ncbi:MAG: InlB B-repeat-containing protein, partial [Methanomassiliicoccaceae archaeon]|nr:InlB B-repeat-containing protein [Methanomassiliicoccaceae archaeon]
MHKKGTSGRVSALVAVAVVLIMLAVPITTLNFSTEYTKASPLATVSYDANGGTGAVPATSTFEKGLDSSQVLFDPLPTRAGYVFIGWSVNDPYGAVEYDFTTLHEDRFFVGEDNTTFYAQWQEIPATSKKVQVGTTNRDTNREVTWDAGLGVYKYRLGTGAWENLEDNIIQFSGDPFRQATLIFSLTGGVPYPDDYRLYVVFDNITINNGSGATADGNAVNIMPGAKVILQLVGNSTIDHQGGSLGRNATIRVVDNGTLSSDLIITGQGNGKLTMTKTGQGDPGIGTVIGGDGLTTGPAAETAGHIQIESGIIDITSKATRTRGAAIGGGSSTDGSQNGGDGGIFEMHGGTLITYQEATGAAFYSPAIGGGAGTTVSSSRAGHGGDITITGGTIDITQKCTNTTYGIRAAAIGGGAAFSTKAGDSGTIKISGGNINITQQGGAISGSGIGASSPQEGAGKAGQAIGINETGGQNYIAISGGHIEIKQTNTSTLYGTLRGAGIGGGAGGQSGIPGGGADVRISGGYVMVDRISTATLTRGQGAGIGGGAEETRPSEIQITGGNVNVKIAITSATPANYAGAAFGCNLNPHTDSFVKIDGGVINISRTRGGADLAVPVGSDGDFGKAPVINGGSIRLTGDLAFEANPASANTPKDSQGHPLYRAKVVLAPTDNPQSLFVKKASVIDDEFGTERYVDFHVQGRHKNLQAAGDYGYLNLYLPQTGEHTISLEVSADGKVDTYVADYTWLGNTTFKSNLDLLYRVVYRIGERMRYEDDIVHINNYTKFKNSIRATNDAVNDVVAPWNTSYVERHNIDYNDNSLAKNVTSLAGQYDYFASETPLAKAPNNVINPEVLTSYGNIEFNANISGRLVITMEEVNRVNVQYRDDFTYLEDTSIPGARQIDRVFGEGYPAILVGLASDDDPVTGPWAQNDAPIAHTLPEPDDVIWTSDLFMFVEWRLGDPTTGAVYDTEDPYTITAGTGDLVFYSVWEWKGKIYITENGPGHVEYSLDDGVTWKTKTATDDGGTFFPVPLQTVKLKAVPDMDAVFLQWGGDVSGNNPNASVTVTGTLPEDAKHVTAWFWQDDDVYTLTVDENGGNVNVKVGTMPAFDYDGIPVNVPKGSEVVLTASHATKTFAYWEGTVNSSDNPLTISSFNKDHTEKAVFAEPDWKLLTVNTNGGSITVTIPASGGVGTTTFDYTGPVLIAPGVSVQLESVAPPVAGAKFYRWTGDVSSAENPVTFTMDTAKTVTANYTDADGGKTLTITITGSGTVNITSGSDTFAYPGTPINVPTGTTLSLQAIPAALPANVFVWWTGDLHGHVNPQNLTMDANKAVGAEFSFDTYTVTATKSGGGSGKVQYKQDGVWNDFTLGTALHVPTGMNLDVQAVPDTNNSFLFWTGDLSGEVAAQTIVADGSNKNIDAQFELTTDTVLINLSVSPASTGTGWAYYFQNGADQVFPASGSLRVLKNSTTKLTEKPDTGSVFVRWSVDGTLVFTPSVNVSVGTTGADVVVTYAASGGMYTVTVSKDGDAAPAGKVEYNLGTGWSDYTGVVNVLSGESIQLRATVGTGSKFVWWTGDLSGPIAEQTISGITSNKAVTAWFYDDANTTTVTATTSGTGSGKVQFQQNGVWQDFPDGGVLTVPVGHSLPLQAVPAAGNSFIIWSYDLKGTANPQTLSSITSPKKVDAWFEPTTNTATVTANRTGDGNGTVEFFLKEWQEFSYGTAQLVPLGNLDVRAVPATAADVFLFWTGDLSGEVAAQTLDVDGNKTIDAQFEKLADTVLIKFSTDGSGSGWAYYFQNGSNQVFPASGSLRVLKSTTTKLTEKPDAGSVLVMWMVNGVPAFTTSVDVAVGTTDSTVVATYSSSGAFTVTVSKDGDTSAVDTGKVWYDLGLGGGWVEYVSAVTVPSGNSISLKAEAATGTTFVWWTGDLSGPTDEQTISSITNNKAVTAWFYDDANTTTVTATTSGTGSGKVQFQQNGVWQDFPTGGVLTVPVGHSLPMQAVPATNNSFILWSYDLKGATNPQTLSSITSPKEVDAWFEPTTNTATVTATMSGGGVGTVEFFLKEWQEFSYGTPQLVPKGDLDVRAVPATAADVFLFWTGDL